MQRSLRDFQYAEKFILRARDIELNNKQKGFILDDANALLQQIRNYKEEVYISNAVLISFGLKELIESAQMLKYFAKEIIGIQRIMPQVQNIELPAFTKYNCFWIGIHWSASTIGALSLPTTKINLVAKITMPLLSSVAYGTRLYVNDALIEKKQAALEEKQENNQITNLEGFKDKCGLDIAAYGGLSLLNGGINKFMLGISLPIIAYEAAISGTIGGLQCYNFYNQVSKQPTAQSQSLNTKVLLVDFAAFCIATSSIGLDLTNAKSKIVAIKQAMIVISSVVMTDQLTKLAIGLVEKFFCSRNSE